MNRAILHDLIAWKDDPERMPLLLRGARQVGKTYIVERFGASYFTHCVTLNFDLQPHYAACFASLNPVEILQRIHLATGETLIPGVSLLFLDEIQQCPAAIAAMRYFKEQMPTLHVIGAGSLLEFTLNDPDFRMPVGRVQSLYLKPLSFMEYLEASDQPALLDYVKQLDLSQKTEPLAHDQLLTCVREYCLLGGMPAVVKSYLVHRDFDRAQKMQSILMNTYRNDFGQYARQAQHKYLKTLFDRVPGLISQRFKYSKIDPDVKSREIKAALSLLFDAGLIYRVYHSAGSSLPLDTLMNEKIFKVLFMDIGLVNYITGADYHLLLDPQASLNHRGVLAEQFVGQELLAYQAKHEAAKLFFWARDQRSSQAEVDFLANVGGHITPIEVKSGTTGRLRSLQIFLQEKHLPLGVRISESPLSLEKNILSVPFYLMSEIPRLSRQAR